MGGGCFTVGAAKGILHAATIGTVGAAIRAISLYTCGCFAVVGALLNAVALGQMINFYWKYGGFKVESTYALWLFEIKDVRRI